MLLEGAEVVVLEQPYEVRTWRVMSMSFPDHYMPVPPTVIREEFAEAHWEKRANVTVMSLDLP